MKSDKLMEQKASSGMKMEYEWALHSSIEQDARHLVDYTEALEQASFLFLW